MYTYLVEFYYPSGEYAYEMSDKIIFDTTELREKWDLHSIKKEAFKESCWEVTKCEVEPVLELSENLKDGWYTVFVQTDKRDYFTITVYVNAAD